jgi:hypothetical protein
MERIKRQQQKKKTNRRAITDEHSPHWVKKKQLCCGRWYPVRGGEEDAATNLTTAMAEGEEKEGDQY